MSIEIVLPPEPRTSLELFALHLAQSIGATTTSSDAGSPDRALLVRDGVTCALRLDAKALCVHVDSRGTSIGSISYSLDAGAREPHPRLRILFAGGESSDRRLRMTAKAVGEMRSRRRAAEFLAAGAVPDDWTRPSLPRQLFADLTAYETLRLVRASSCVLECGDENETPTDLALIATAAAVPVVVHRSSVLASRYPERVVAVEEWSADAFVDAISVPLRDVSPPAHHAAAELLEILERARG